MADPQDSVELNSHAPLSGPAGQSEETGARAYLRLWFRCAGQYARAYRNASGTGYSGRCPKCSQTIRFQIGAGGTSERFFEVSC